MFKGTMKRFSSLIMAVVMPPLVPEGTSGLPNY